MFRLLKRAHLLAPTTFCLTIMLAFAWTVIGNPLLAAQNGQKPNPNIDYEKQRTEQYDQQQQQQQQQQYEDALRHARNDFDQFQKDSLADGMERARMKYLLRENFRHHYKVIRNDAEELTQLAAQFQSYVESAPAPELPRIMLDKLATMQKLAHEVRASMAGRSLPKVKPSAHAANALGTSAVTDLDRKQALMERSKSITDLTSRLKKAVEAYLASDNEQMVSVDALKKSNDKTQSQFDPNSVEIVKTSLQLEQLACDIRTEKPVVGPSR